MTHDQMLRLRAAVDAVLPTVRELRHRLHQEPEIHFEERRTRAKIAAALAPTSLKVWPPLLETDLIAELPGREPGRVLCLRADIDALPIVEQTGVPHQSQVPGMMHACGHDGHTAMLVGTALVLEQLRDLLPVTVRLVFQPAEEMVAGGRYLVEKGACRGAEMAFALHGGPGRPVGTVSSMPGAMMAAADFFELTFTGKGGHGAMPELAVNPHPVAARFVLAMDALHRELNQRHRAVVTVTSVKGGDAANVIPDAVKLLGTIRYLEPDLGDPMRQRIRDAVAELTAGTGVTGEIKFQGAYELPLINAERAVGYLQRVVATHLGAQSYRPEPGPLMVSEDFAFFLNAAPGAMFWLGLGEQQPGLHSPFFDFNDDALPTGILTFCLLALNYDQA